jgi:hypothetical protein
MAAPRHYATLEIRNKLSVLRAQPPPLNQKMLITAASLQPCLNGVMRAFRKQLHHHQAQTVSLKSDHNPILYVNNLVAHSQMFRSSHANRMARYFPGMTSFFLSAPNVR